MKKLQVSLGESLWILLSTQIFCIKKYKFDWKAVNPFKYSGCVGNFKKSDFKLLQVFQKSKLNFHH